MNTAEEKVLRLCRAREAKGKFSSQQLVRKFSHDHENCENINKKNGGIVCSFGCVCVIIHSINYVL